MRYRLGQYQLCRGGNVCRSSAYAPTRASSVKLLLSPLGLGRIQAVVSANSCGYKPQPTSDLPIMAEKARFPRKAITRGAYRRIFASNAGRACLNSPGRTSSARLVGRRTTAVMPQPYSSNRCSSCGCSRTPVKPARYSTGQKRLFRFEKLWPSATALEAGLRPQKTTSRPGARISDSYPIKPDPLPHWRTRQRWVVERRRITQERQR